MGRTQEPGTLSCLHLPLPHTCLLPGGPDLALGEGLLSSPSLWLLREAWPKPSPLWASVSSLHGQGAAALGVAGSTLVRCACAGAGTVVIMSWALRRVEPLCLHLPGETFQPADWAEGQHLAED